MEVKKDFYVDVNKPADPNNMTDLEKKHLPVITAPDKVKPGECFEVTVEVGKLLEHPNQLSHYIEFLDLYAGHVFLARMDLIPVKTCPVMKVCLNLDKNIGDLRAFEHCNLHGTWESSKPIEVSE